MWGLNMNKFELLHCIDVNENEYDGPAVVLVCTSDPSFVLFFPIPKEQAKLITYILDDNKYDMNSSILGIYKTMIESWNASDRHLAGIVMDAVYSEEMKDDVMSLRLAVIDQDGNLDSLVPVNFLHAIVLAAMEKAEIIVNEKLIDKMIDTEEEKVPSKNRKDLHTFPEDKKIISIAKKIMNGKIKDN
jgi:hypothetical protein